MLPKFDFLNVEYLIECRTSFDFNNRVLNTSIQKIKKDKMVFNVFSHENKIEPIETIISMILNKKKINLQVRYFDKKGKVLFTNIINDLTFTKTNLTDFKGYQKSLKTIKVKFKYSNIEYINNIDKLQIRKNKLYKLLNIKNTILNKDEIF